MGFKRTILPEQFPKGEELSGDLAGVGMLVATTPSKSPNIENTVFAASVEGMSGDLRTLSLLVDWLDLHSDRVNADRLIKMIRANNEQRVRCFWKAVAQWKKKDLRLKRLVRLYRGQRLDLLEPGTEFVIKRKGEDARFDGTCLRVPNETLRHRPTDILTPEELAKIHDAYRQRIMIGPSYRADMWAELERTGEISASELARKAFGSFATAWQVLRDWSILHSTK
jgi:hypothetical protein